MIKTSIKNAAETSNYFKTLSRKFGISLAQIVRSEMTTVLRNLANTEKAASVSTLQNAGYLKGIKDSNAGEHKITVNTGLRGGKKGLMWLRLRQKDGSTRFIPSGIYNDGNVSPNTKFRDSYEDLEESLIPKLGDAKKTSKLYSKSRGSTAYNWAYAMDRVPEVGDSFNTQVKSFIRRSQRKNNSTPSVDINKIGNPSVRYSIIAQLKSKILEKANGQFRADLQLKKREAFWTRSIKRRFIDDANFLKKYAPWIRAS